MSTPREPADTTADPNSAPATLTDLSTGEVYAVSEEAYRRERRAQEEEFDAHLGDGSFGRRRF